ncbi:MAG TPA: amidohydrolase family protein [Chitinophagaceae bacterium]|jgi:predicted TIM-barrel fold metal-dependent hydrolase|nr:amidohydrolase family protein [Chitinophagaceae bacterium]
MKLYTDPKRLLSNFMVLVVAAFILPACNSDDSNSYYATEDFYKVKKIDVHAHALTTDPAFVQQARDDDFILISLNTEVPYYPPIDSQQYITLQLHRNFPDNIYYVTTFGTKTINQPGWSDRQLAYLKRSFDSGAIGVKVWKNIGMTIRDKDSNFIMVDDPVFDPIFNYLEQNDIPVIGHIGEPKNCWLPLGQMTTNNDRAYFATHPEYHMYLHPEYPSYDDIIRSRDHLLEKHPRLRFIGAHLASLEWDVGEIAKRLDKFPNMSVEPSARLGQLQYQSIQNWQKVHDFFIRYQDRIMYGTDLQADESQTPEEVKKQAHERWTKDWKYFTSGDSLHSPFVNRKFKGLHLPKVVVDKIFYKNAEKWYFKQKN